MTIQRPDFTKPHPSGPMCLRAARTSPCRHLLVLGLLSFACAAELEDADEFQTRVRPGAGASGVRLAQDTSAPDNDKTSGSPTSGTTSGDSTGGDSTTDVADCGDVPTRILQAKCSGAACHGSPGAPTELYSDIASSTDPMHFLDVPAKYTCSAKMLIDSETPADSALLSVVQANGHCSGGQMPSGGPYLSAEDISCLTEWVNAVASGAI